MNLVDPERHLTTAGARTRRMKPPTRKALLTLHIVFSVGWVGAVLAYLALAVAGLASGDSQRITGAYLAMEMIARWVIVPCSFLAVVFGVVLSLLTEWGLVRHYWVLVKLVLSVIATTILLLHFRVIVQMAARAAEAIVHPGEAMSFRVPLLVHAGGGLIALLAITVISIFKPWGLTPFGRKNWPT